MSYARFLMRAIHIGLRSLCAPIVWLLRSGLDRASYCGAALCTLYILDSPVWFAPRICGPHYIMWMDVHPLIRDCAHSVHCVCRANASYTAWYDMRGF